MNQFSYSSFNSTLFNQRKFLLCDYCVGWCWNPRAFPMVLWTTLRRTHRLLLIQHSFTWLSKHRIKFDLIEMALLSSFSRCLLSSFLNSKTFFLDRLISQAADTSLNLRRTPTSEMTQVKKKRFFFNWLFWNFLMFGWIHRTCIRGNRFCHLNMKAGTIARLSHRLYTSLGARRTVVEAVARSPSTDWIKVLRVMATAAAAAAVTERNLKMASSASTSLHHTETNQNSHASTLKRLSVCNILNMIFQLLFFSLFAKF